MKARVLFGVAGFVFVLLALYVFPPAVLSIALTILCALATYELTAATGLVKNRQVAGCCIGCSVILGYVMYRKAEDKLFWIAAIVLTLLIALFALLLRHHDTTAFQEIAVGLFGGAALPLLLLSLWRIFAMDGGEFLVLLPVGGVAGATVLMLLVAVLFNRFAGLDIHYGAAALMGAAGAAIGQVGDLSFSIIKRQAGIKDYGHIFPGHGGVLDRFDSVIFVAPVAELILRAFGV